MSDQSIDNGLPRVIGEELQVSMIAVRTLYEMLIETGVVSRQTAVTRLRQSTDRHAESHTSTGLLQLADHLAQDRQREVELSSQELLQKT